VQNKQNAKGHLVVEVENEITDIGAIQDRYQVERMVDQVLGKLEVERDKLGKKKMCLVREQAEDIVEHRERGRKH